MTTGATSTFERISKKRKQKAVATLEDIFAACVRTESGCIEWAACRNSDGYGIAWLSREGRTTVAHRIAWEFAHGEPPPKHLVVCHRCDNPPCVNPAHLFLGTRSDNGRDMISKERLPTAVLNRETVLAMKRDRSLLGMTYYDLGQKYQCSHATAHRACTGHSWRHVMEDSQ